MVPATVAAMLKAGVPVPPKMYPSATVLFSDIVGFTSMCARSTPVQVVALLDSLFTNFDSIVTSHDAYKVKELYNKHFLTNSFFKVETIGDAYMIASGLPTENGQQHIEEIADISVSLVAAVGRLYV